METRYTKECSVQLPLFLYEEIANISIEGEMVVFLICLNQFITSNMYGSRRCIIHDMCISDYRSTIALSQSSAVLDYQTPRTKNLDLGEPTFQLHESSQRGSSESK